VAKKGDVVAKVDKDACGKEGDDSGIGGTEEGAGDEGGNDDDCDNDGGIIAPGDDYCMESRSINIVSNSGDEGKWDENVVNAITRDLGQKIVTTQHVSDIPCLFNLNSFPHDWLHSLMIIYIHLILFEFDGWMELMSLHL